jgi:hypothetical protein
MVILVPQIFNIELSLTSRAQLKCNMLMYYYAELEISELRKVIEDWLIKILKSKWQFMYTLKTDRYRMALSVLWKTDYSEERRNSAYVSRNISSNNSHISTFWSPKIMILTSTNTCNRNIEYVLGHQSQVESHPSKCNYC